ncbi:MAG: NAD(P)H-hydrate dehydratase [Anaerolineales bacterium]|nr:NAD(P)H-hydrate dehydratase [Anaerolineales bacterium]
MKKVVTVEQMRAIEQAADASGLTYDQMMENAGKSIAAEILDYWPDVGGWSVTILVGPGNNGGDGLVVGHYLHKAGAKVSVYLTGARTEEDENLQRIIGHGCPLSIAEKDKQQKVLKNWIVSTDLLVDSVIGTGFKPPIKGDTKKILALVKSVLGQRASAPYIVAVDCPSGLDCDTGEIADESLRADLTVTLAAAKPGLLRFPGAEFVGEIVVGDIGIPSSQNEIAAIDLEFATREGVRAWLPDRPRDAHKGTFGRVMIVAGSVNFPGAASLSALGAYRSGAGLVTLAVPEPIQKFLVSMIPEATWLVLPHELGVITGAAADVIYEELPHCQALLLGPGFGQETATLNFMKRLITPAAAAKQGIGFVRREGTNEMVKLPPIVIDADGLKLLAGIPDWHVHLPRQSVLTPHPGEMSVMTGLSVAEIQMQRERIALDWAARWGQIVVLKGAFTVVASPFGQATILPFATPALARAGTGDVLSGVIASLLAQGLQPYQAAILGCFIHGMAGEIAAGMIGSTAGVIAGDVAELIPSAISELECR